MRRSTTDDTRPFDDARQDGVFASLRPGAVFAERFEIRERLGAGGAGEVFRVYDRLAAEEAAIKVLFPGAHGVERVLREVRIARAIEHPGIVRIRDIGEHDGLLYLLMPLLVGETLKARLSRGPLTLADAIGIMDALLEALAFAHARGVVHRDVKPANVFIARDEDGSERVVLLDLGLARDDDQPALTATGQFLGTPEYVSPEQARGDRTLGPAADLYSAGVVLWEMLAGAPPFVGETSLEVVLAHATNPLPSPRRSLRGVPAWLEELLLELLEKDPRRRPRDAGAALVLLRAGDVRPLSRRLRRTARRVIGRPLVLALTAVAVAVLAFFPHVSLEQGELVVRNPIGMTLWRPAIDRLVVAMAPVSGGPWSREHLVLLGSVERKAFPPEIPLGVVRVDLLRRTVTPLVPQTGSLTWIPMALPRYDAVFSGRWIVRTPWLDSEGVRLFLAAYSHESDYPAALVLFSAEGHVSSFGTHPGSLNLPPVFLRDGGRDVAVLAGTNNLLGRRHVVIGFSQSIMVGSRISFPPFEPLARFEVLPDFYSPLPSAGEYTLTADGRRGVLASSDGAGLSFDLATGVPLNEDAGAWTARRARWTSLLETSTQTARLGQPREAARLLIAFAREAPRPGTLEATALARAAEFLRAAGEPALALPLAREASALEPLIPGHYRLLIDLYEQLDAWPALEAALAALPSPLMHIPEVSRDRFVGALLQNRLAETRPLVGHSGPADYYATWQEAALRLFEGEPEAARETLPAVFRFRDYPEFAFLDALAFALGERLDPEGALERLELAESGKGTGQVLPFVPLRAYLAGRAGRPQPAPAAIAAALEEQRAAARENIVDRLWLPWAEALAAGAAQARGDRAEFERLSKALHTRHGRGPWLDLLLARSMK